MHHLESMHFDFLVGEVYNGRLSIWLVIIWSWKQEIETEKALYKNSVDVQEDLSDDLMKIDGVPEENLTPFMRLFWTEQMKYIRCTNKQPLKYHPTIIKYCLDICAKSTALQHTNNQNLLWYRCLVLPPQRTLRQYHNYVKRGQIC